jgi:hypothetical protein
VPLSRAVTMEVIGQRRLGDFVTSASFGFFDIAGISRDFLAMDPSDWPTHPSYAEGKSIVDGLRIVNDCAERGVRLITEYINSPLTKDEEQLQFLLQIVKGHREQLPTLNKKGIS